MKGALATQLLSLPHPLPRYVLWILMVLLERIQALLQSRLQNSWQGFYPPPFYGLFLHQLLCISNFQHQWFLVQETKDWILQALVQSIRAVSLNILVFPDLNTHLNRYIKYFAPEDWEEHMLVHNHASDSMGTRTELLLSALFYRKIFLLSFSKAQAHMFHTSCWGLCDLHSHQSNDPWERGWARRQLI